MFERRLSLDTANNAYLLDCTIRNLKPSSILDYKKKLKVFFDFCTSNQISDVSELTPPFIKQFQQSLTQSNKSDRYIFNICVVVNTFLKFCVDEQIVETPLKVKLPRVQSKVKQAFTKEEVSTILKACNSKRDYLICILLLDTGLRSNELVSVDIRDIDLNQGLIKVRNGKYGERFVSIGAKVRKSLLLYIGERKRGILLKSNRGQGLTLSGLIQLMKRLKKKTGIPHLHCHTFRRTFAINSVRQSVNIHVLAKIMGHKDVETLKQYLDITLDDIKTLSYSLVDNL